MKIPFFFCQIYFNNSIFPTVGDGFNLFRINNIEKVGDSHSLFSKIINTRTYLCIWLRVINEQMPRNINLLPYFELFDYVVQIMCSIGFLKCNYVFGNNFQIVTVFIIIFPFFTKSRVKTKTSHFL